MILIALAAIMGFSLGAFAVGMLHVHNEYCAFKAGYMAVMDTDQPPQMVEAEVMEAYKRAAGEQ